MVKSLLLIVILSTSLAVSGFVNLAYLTGNNAIDRLITNAAMVQSDNQDVSETTLDDCGTDTISPSVQDVSSNSSEKIQWPDMLLVNASQSRVITITSQPDSSGFPSEGSTENKVLMTVGNITIRSEENTIENIPKRKGFVSAYIYYTLENLENRAFYPHIDVYALVEGARYPCQLCGGGDTGSLLLPHEKRYNMWTAFQVPNFTRQIVFDVVDIHGPEIVWSLPVNVTLANGIPITLNETVGEENAADVTNIPVNDTVSDNNLEVNATSQPSREPKIRHLVLDESHKQKQITIQNSESSVGVTQNDAILTVEDVTLYSDKDMQYMPYKPGHNILVINYSLTNIDDHPYFVQLGYEASGSSPDYRIQEIGWPFGNQIIPNEIIGWGIGIYIPDEDTDISIKVIDTFSDATVWTIPLKINEEVEFPEAYGNTSKLPDDFAVTYSYGIGLDYALDTRKGVFAVKTCDEPALQNVILALSDEELLKIWKAAAENDFMNIGDFVELCPSDAFSGCTVVTPESRTELTIYGNNRSNTILARENYENNHNVYQYPEFAKYKSIVQAIDEVLAKYQDKIPDSKCAYL